MPSPKTALLRSGIRFGDSQKLAVAVLKQVEHNVNARRVAITRVRDVVCSLRRGFVRNNRLAVGIAVGILPNGFSLDDVVFRGGVSTVFELDGVRRRASGAASDDVQQFRSHQLSRNGEGAVERVVESNLIRMVRPTSSPYTVTRDVISALVREVDLDKGLSRHRRVGDSVERKVQTIPVCVLGSRSNSHSSFSFTSLLNFFV